MAVERAEALVLRTWPFQESDLIVSLFTREHGRLKGVAKAGLKSRKRFGGALEPMTHVEAAYAERPRQELVRLDGLEILHSPLEQPVDYARAAALALYAEVLEGVLPEGDPQETLFRLVLAVLEYTTAQNPWAAVTYFVLWVPRLMGWLPSLERCMVCGDRLGSAGIFFHPATDGLVCGQHRRAGSYAMQEDGYTLAKAVLRTPLPALVTLEWSHRRAQDLRRFCVLTLERHLEDRLKAAEALSRMGK